MIFAQPTSFKKLLALAVACLPFIHGGLSFSNSGSTPSEIEYAEYLTPQASFDWKLQCQGCHGPNGEGMIKREVPRLTGEVSKFILTKEGREFIARVPGVSGSPLSDDRLADVLNWMLVTLDHEHLTRDWKHYSAEEVKALRQNPIRTNISLKRALIMASIDDYLSSSKPNLEN